uniref:Uncharacterized protein n=1 Tax=Fagus sylvatica TaxID=28930 RepID=A0A2N9F8I0_FAGSY
MWGGAVSGAGRDKLPRPPGRGGVGWTVTGRASRGARLGNEGNVIRFPNCPVSVSLKLTGLHSCCSGEALVLPAYPDGPSHVTKGINVGS